MRRRACFGKASWHLTPQLGLGALGAQAVDNLLLTREAISCVAARAGLSTSFLPKLGPSEAGSGAHCHISLFNVRARARPLHDPPVQPCPIPGACRVWGVDNREAPLRLSASAGAGAQNWEFRALDATADPHLALAAVIAAGCQAVPCRPGAVRF